MVYHSNSPEDTMKIATLLGENATSGQVYCLIGDLGVGKTVFTKGFARAIGVHEQVVSPTFTIINEYMGNKMPFYHFDVYRIQDLDEMDEIGYEDYFFGDGISFVEWANYIEDIIPEDAIWIYVEKDLRKGLNYRKITVHGLLQ